MSLKLFLGPSHKIGTNNPHLILLLELGHRQVLFSSHSIEN